MGEGDDENDDNGVMRLIVNIYEVVISHTLVSQADPKMALNDPHFLMFTPLYNLFPLSVGWPNDFFF